MRDFQYGPHLLVQDIFRAETPDHVVAVTYDDVEEGIQLHVTFKNRWTNLDHPLAHPKRVSVKMRNAREAVARAADFIARQKIQEPYCALDY